MCLKYEAIKLLQTTLFFKKNLHGFIMSGKRVNRSLYRTGQALRVPEEQGSQFSKQFAHEDGKVVSLTHRPSLPEGIIRVLISFRG